MTEPASPTEQPQPKQRPPTKAKVKAKQVGLATRIVFGGAALGAGLAMVGGMAAGARSSTNPVPPTQIVRVVVAQDRTRQPTPPPLPVAAAETSVPTAAPVTESGGS